MAKGRVWLGADAVNIGLVDEIGGLVTTLNYAKKQAGDLPITVWPKVKENDLRDFLEMFDEQEQSNEDASVKISDEVLNYYKEIQKLENKFGIQMRMPYELKF